MSEMDKKRREAIRYLGFGRNAADERTYELIEASFDDLNRETSPRFVYRIFDLDHSVDGLLAQSWKKVDCIFGQGSALDMGTSRSSSRSRS